jgi:glycyl-tRNA synthetase
MVYSEVFQKVVSHAKEHGFIFQSSELYDGLGGVYDYGSLGVLLKRNIAQAWWRSMVQLNDNIVGLDSAILMHPTVWKASGHVDAFSDPLIDNRDSNKRYRADVLIEDAIERHHQKAVKDVEKKFAKEARTEPVSPEEFERRLAGDRSEIKARELAQRLADALTADDLAALKTIIDEAEIAEPETGSRNWTEVRQFNLMFKTQLGALLEGSSDLYLRPETAQGIFVNFLNVQKSMRMKVPFGIAQIGKAFRNEIIARQFIFRMREFEQMEMQFFVRPGTQLEWYERWRDTRMAWHRSLGLPEHRLKFKIHDKLAHYADAAVDIQFDMPFGFKEMEGIHSRTDFDLARHAEFSGKKLTYFDPETNESYVPYVVETSVGLDRTFLAHLCNAYTEEEAPTAEGGTDIRTVLKLHPRLAPITVCVLPLVKKDELVEPARRIAAELREHFMVNVEEGGDSIGRRYRRWDAKGTPYCVTVDFDTVADGTVTLRHRDTMHQERIPAAEISSKVQAGLR